MRLTELDPRWVTGKRSTVPEGEGKRGHVGLTFKCPCCLGTDRATRLGVLFDPPIDDGVLWLWATWPPIEGTRWQRSGETFDGLSLTPSINAANYGHWHGVITNGEAT